MTVSILGCGWFGMALAGSLVGSGITVKGSTTSPDKLEKFRQENIKPYLIDLSGNRKLAADFLKCDVLVIAIPPKSRSGLGNTYVPKLQRAINCAILQQVQKVVLISSTGVYADLNREVNEFDDPEPVLEPGNILLQAEELLMRQTFKCSIIRFGGLVGPGRDPGRFFAGKTNVPNGFAPVNLIHLDDCTGIVRAVIQHDAFNFIFNACAPHHPQKMEFYTKAAIKASLPVPQFIPELKEWKIVSSSNVKNILGYEYMVSNWDEWLDNKL